MRGMNTGLRRRHVVRPVRPVFRPFPLIPGLTSQRPTLRRRFRAFLPPASGFRGRVEKGGEGVIVSLILPCSFRHSPATMAAVDELDNKYSMDGPAWCGRSNKSLIVLTILSVLHEREFLFLFINSSFI